MLILTKLLSWEPSQEWFFEARMVGAKCWNSLTCGQADPNSRETGVI
jgi:hypothetical protein